MLQSPQFVHILAAERELLVTVSIALPSDAKENFEQRLVGAFSSTGFTDTARAWNEERMKVVREAVDHHLLAVGVKWTREWIREEVEDFLAWRCSDVLREVSAVFTLVNTIIMLHILSE
jgi:transcription elongation factor SPT6